MVERNDRQQQDHDLLMRIDANMTNFIEKLKQHEDEDKIHFNRLYARTSRLEKVVWMGLGIIAAAEFVLRVMQ